MRGRSEGLYLWTRHSDDCKYVKLAADRDQSRRWNCMKYLAGCAPDGTRFRESTGTTSWEKARKILARKLAEHDPVNKPLFGVTVSERATSSTKTITKAVEQFLETKRGESVVDMAHYEGLFNREFLPWCKEQGLFDVAELGLEQVTSFRNQLSNKGTVKNRKLSRLRSFLAFCMDRRWIGENPAKQLKPANEDDPSVDYFHPEEIQKLLEASRCICAPAVLLVVGLLWQSPIEFLAGFLHRQPPFTSTSFIDINNSPVIVLHSDHGRIILPAKG